jgi:hypothetical protein
LPSLSKNCCAKLDAPLVAEYTIAIIKTATAAKHIWRGVVARPVAAMEVSPAPGNIQTNNGI